MEMSRLVAIKETTDLLRLLLIGAMIAVSLSLIVPIQSVMAETVSVESLDTTSGSRGSTIEGIIITGSGFTDATSVSFGEGITVTDFTDDSDTQITADVNIDSAADLGARDITVTTPTTENLDQSQTQLSSNFYIYNDGTSDRQVGQTFTAGLTGELTKIALTLRRIGSPSDAIKVEIRDATVDYTPGDASTTYASATKDANDISSVEYAEYEFVFSSPVIMTSGDSYAIHISTAGGDSSNYYRARFQYNDVTDPYTGGRYSYSTDGGTSWYIGYGIRADLYFKTYITTAGSTGTLADGFTVQLAAPTVAAISPSFGAQGGTIDMTITGTDLADATAIDLGIGIIVNSFLSGPTQITVNATIDPYATINTRNISVTNEGGVDTLDDQFTVIAPPTITAVSPNSANPGDTLDVIITGSNFFEGSEVDFGTGVTVNGHTVDTPTQITANITLADSAEIGANDISVTTGGVVGTLIGGLPIESSYSPSSGNDFDWTWLYLSAAALAVCAVVVSGAHVLRTHMVRRPGDDTWHTVAEASIEMNQFAKLPLVSRLVLPENASTPDTSARPSEHVSTHSDEKGLSHLIEELLLDSNGNPCPLKIGDMSDKDMDNAIRALERIDDRVQEQTWGNAARAIKDMIKAD